MAVNRIPRIILDGDEESSSYMAREGIRQLGILKDLMGFSNLQQDIRKVEYIDGSRIVCRSCFGEDIVYIYTEKKEEGEEKEKKLYVYATISDYVTIWDLSTGEAAEDVCNNEGRVYDDDGNPLVTFPCHKDVLVRWLEGIKDRPTRQVLKDDPEDRKDYLDDNHKDMGEENRVEKHNPHDPSADCYFGITDTANFENNTDEIDDGCLPYCCQFDDPNEPCILPNLDSCTLFIKNTWDTPLGDYPDSQNSLIVNALTDNHCDGFFTYTGHVFWEICRNYRRTHQTTSYVKYLQTYFLLSKHLYLCTYPSPQYSPPLSYVYINYCCPETTRYKNPIDFAVDRTDFICKYWFLRQQLPLRKNNRYGKSLTIRTDMGSLLLDYTPSREWVEDSPMLYELMSEAAEGCGCFYENIPEGVCSKITDFEIQAHFWEDSYCGQPTHATDTCAWSTREEHVLVDDLLASENKRTGVSWCGSKYNYRSPPDDQVSGWYRILLRFTMGKFFTEGNVTEYCPNDPVIIEEWDNRAASERFSSVQATIELEKPKDYPKKINATYEYCIDGECAEYLRYKRPDEYEGHEEDFTLCAFPGRTQGYEEDLENNICYPFDGTYDIFTLGEAVEELINSCYVDGSDDPLLVYLYERPNMVQQSTG